jgi:hypothetical protein
MNTATRGFENTKSGRTCRLNGVPSVAIALEDRVTGSLMTTCRRHPVIPARRSADANCCSVRRFDYRRIHAMIRREGLAVNCKRVQRIYREERLQSPGASAGVVWRWSAGRSMCVGRRTKKLRYDITHAGL